MEARLREERGEADARRDARPGHEREHDSTARSATTRAAWVEITGWYAVSRAIVFAVAAVVQAVDAPVGRLNPNYLVHPVGLLGAWDGNWYRFVAVRGYLDVPGHVSDTAFFPLFPVLISALHRLGISTYAAGIVLSNALFLLGLLVFYELGRTLLPESDARRAAVYAAVFPVGFVFSMEYPESLAFLLIGAAALLAARGRWLGSAACAAGAVLARPEGFFVVLPVAVLAVHAWPRLDVAARAKATAAVLAAPAALLSFSLYMWWAVGSLSATRDAEEEWGRQLSIDGVRKAFDALGASNDAQPWLLRDALLCLLYVLCLALAARARVGWEWIVFGLAIVLLPLASGSFQSVGRFGLLAFPAFWGLAVLGRRRALDIGFLVAAPVLLGLATVSIVYAPP